jgi:hypothetical protein
MALLKDCPVRTDWLGVLLLSVIFLLPLTTVTSCWCVFLLVNRCFKSWSVSVTPVFLMCVCLGLPDALLFFFLHGFDFFLLLMLMGLLLFSSWSVVRSLPSLLIFLGVVDHTPVVLLLLVVDVVNDVRSGSSLLFFCLLVVNDCVVGSCCCINDFFFVFVVVGA